MFTNHHTVVFCVRTSRISFWFWEQQNIDARRRIIQKDIPKLHDSAIRFGLRKHYQYYLRLPAFGGQCGLDLELLCVQAENVPKAVYQSIKLSCMDTRICNIPAVASFAGILKIYPFACAYWLRGLCFIYICSTETDMHLKIHTSRRLKFRLHPENTHMHIIQSHCCYSACILCLLSRIAFCHS